MGGAAVGVCGCCGVGGRRCHCGGGRRCAGTLVATSEAAATLGRASRVPRRAVGHERAGAGAAQLAAGREALGLRVEPKPQTNMVFFEISDAPAFRHACAERDLLVNPVTATRFRAVTHLDVGDQLDLGPILWIHGEKLVPR